MDQRILYYSVYLLITLVNPGVNNGNTINKIDDVIPIDLDIC